MNIYLNEQQITINATGSTWNTVTDTVVACRGGYVFYNDKRLKYIDNNYVVPTDIIGTGGHYFNINLRGATWVGKTTLSFSAVDSLVSYYVGVKTTMTYNGLTVNHPSSVLKYGETIAYQGGSWSGTAFQTITFIGVVGYSTDLTNVNLIKWLLENGTITEANNVSMFGSDNIDKLMIGSDEVDKVYIGMDLVFDSKPQLATPTISLSGDTLSIEEVENAEYYDIYVDGVLEESMPAVEPTYEVEFVLMSDTNGWAMCHFTYDNKKYGYYYENGQHNFYIADELVQVQPPGQVYIGENYIGSNWHIKGTLYLPMNQTTTILIDVDDQDASDDAGGNVTISPSGYSRNNRTATITGNGWFSIYSID